MCVINLITKIVIRHGTEIKYRSKHIVEAKYQTGVFTFNHIENIACGFVWMSEHQRIQY